MRKLCVLTLAAALLLAGCTRRNRLDASGVEVDWLEQTVGIETISSMPTAPAEERPEAAPTVQTEETEPSAAAAQTEPDAASEPETTEPESGKVEQSRAAGMRQTILTLSDGRKVSCWLYIPEKTYAASGLIVYLHGGSGKGEDLNLITQAEGFPQYLQSGLLGDVSSYVLIPQLPKEQKGWSDFDGTLMDMIQTVVQEYGVDASNISLTGHSMGGTGTWSIAAAHPGFFARIAPLSGSIRNSSQNVQALKDTPVYAFVGMEDTIVKPESTAIFVQALKEAGGDARLVELAGADHFAVPGEAYLGDYGLLSWLEGK